MRLLREQTFELGQSIFYKTAQKASVADLDTRPTDDQEVAGSTPLGSASFFRGN